MPSYEEKMEAAAKQDEAEAAKKAAKKKGGMSLPSRPCAAIFQACPNCGRKFNQMAFTAHVATCAAQQQQQMAVQMQAKASHADMQQMQMQIASKANAGFGPQMANEDAARDAALRRRHETLNGTDGSGNNGPPMQQIQQHHQQQQAAFYAPVQAHAPSGRPIIQPHPPFRPRPSFTTHTQQSAALTAATATAAAAVGTGGGVGQSTVEDIRQLLATWDYGKGEWSPTFACSIVAFDFKGSINPARNIAKRTMKKLIKGSHVMRSNQV
jgi:hypothetical protein